MVHVQIHMMSFLSVLTNIIYIFEVCMKNVSFVAVWFISDNIYVVFIFFQVFSYSGIFLKKFNKHPWLAII